jgi:hypothetical protein
MQGPATKAMPAELRKPKLVRQVAADHSRKAKPPTEKEMEAKHNGKNSRKAKPPAEKETKAKEQQPSEPKDGKPRRKSRKQKKLERKQEASTPDTSKSSSRNSESKSSSDKQSKDKLRKCYNCGKKGHLASDCKRPKKKKKDAGTREDGEKGSPKEVLTPEEKRVKAAENVARIIRDMTAKAAGTWVLPCGKDPTKRTDKFAVASMVGNIGRKEKLHEQLALAGDERQFFEIVSQVCADGMRLGIAERSQTAMHLTFDNSETRDVFQNHFIRYVTLRDLARIRGTPVRRLEQYEAIEPFSKRGETVVAALALALLIHIFFLPIFEELVKRSGHMLVDVAGEQLNEDSHWDMYFPTLDSTNWLDLIPTLLIALIESRIACISVRQGSINFLMRLLAHFYLAQIDLLYSICIHISWNFIIMLSHVFLGTSLSMMLNMLSQFTTLVPGPRQVRSTVQTDICLEHRPIKKIQTDRRFKVKWGECKCKPGFGGRRYWGVSGFVAHCYRKCHHNERISMFGRVAKLVPAASIEKTVNKTWRATANYVTRILNLVRRVRRPKDFEQWIAKHTPAKRALERQLHEEKPDMPRPTASSFIKVELSVRRVFHNALWSDPRFIQGAPPLLNVACGPYITKLVKNFKHDLAPRGWTPAEVREGKQIVYMCGSNAEQVGDIFSQSIHLVAEMMDEDDDIVFLGDDQSRFDLHIREGAFKALDGFYKAKLPANIRKLLLRKVSSGRSMLGSKYSIPWTMQSGWPDTSLGDTVINAMMKYRLHGIGENWISIVMGDDSITITTRKTLSKMGGLDALSKGYAEHGMEIEMQLWDHPLDAEMCSSRFFPVTKADGRETYVLLPKTGKLIAKSLTDLRDRSSAQQLEWLKGIATGHEHTGKVDYLIGAMARGIRRQVGQGKGDVELNPYKIHHTTNVCSTWDQCAVFYDHHYGLSEEAILHAAHELENLQFGESSTDSILQLIVDHDN